MKKGYTILLILLGSLAFLNGCGTTGSGNESTGAPKEMAASKQVPATPEESEPLKQDVDDSKKEEGNMIRIFEQNLEYELNGEKKENTAFLKYNDKQEYSLYVLPEYELSGEEPNTDVLYHLEDDSIFMRIEQLSSDVDWKDQQQNALAQLKTVNNSPKETKMPADPFFNGGWAMEATADGQIVRTYLIKNKQLPLKLMIFSKEGNDHHDAFLQMAKTIAK